MSLFSPSFYNNPLITHCHLSEALSFGSSRCADARDKGACRIVLCARIVVIINNRSVSSGAVGDRLPFALIELKVLRLFA